MNMLNVVMVVYLLSLSSLSCSLLRTEASFSFSSWRSRRSTSTSALTLTLRTQESLLGSHHHRIRLRRQTQLVAPHFTLVLRKADGEVSVNHSTPLPDCLYVGHMDNQKNESNGDVAISTCHQNRLQGLIRAASGPHLILEESLSSGRLKRSATLSSGKLVIYETKASGGECGIKEVNARRMRTPRTRAAVLLDPEAEAEHTGAEQWGRRRRRETERRRSEKAIELAVFVDDVLYQKEKELFPNDDPVQVITDVVFAYLNSVQLMYTSRLLDTSFRLVLVRLEIFESSVSGLEKHEGDIEHYLDSFCTWQRFEKLRTRPTNEQWDHGLLLTGLNLFDGQPRLDSVIGLAWVSGMCHPDYSCTINEGSNFESVFVIAHEMGHNLGMNHDGERSEGNTCDPDKFLMSPVLGPGKVNWSPCSNQEINDFLHSRLTREQAKCLDNLPPVMARFNYLREQQAPGEQFKAIEQCQKAFGNDFTPHVKEESPFENPCRELWCANSSHALRAHPALEGTDCSAKPFPYGSVCQEGQCLPFDPQVREIDEDINEIDDDDINEIDDDDDEIDDDNEIDEGSDYEEEAVPDDVNEMDVSNTIENRPAFYDPLFTQIFEELRQIHGGRYPRGSGQTRIASMLDVSEAHWEAKVDFCPAKCNGGWALANFECVKDGEAVEEHLCLVQHKPQPQKRLCNIQACTLS